MEKEKNKEEAITVRRGEPDRLPVWPNEMDRFFDRMLRAFVPWPRHYSWRRQPFLCSDDWLPSIDVMDGDEKIVVRADLPGLKREDIDVVVENDMLIIRGHRQEEKEIDEKYYRQSERMTGDFYRSIKLPEGVDADSIEATYTDGVLEVTIPLPATPEPKKLKVEVK